ncbi:MAG TPA: heme-binding protein, partial [Steroidobacteraceae bacterium]|nr:heme-binding protein [Steroidobacteraceae bacterium]
SGGHLVAFKRQDGSGILRPQIAHGKAWGALGMGVGGRALAQRAQHAPTFYAALGPASDGQLIPGTGGVLIRSVDGQLLGAVGVSGDMPDNDEACAVRGVEAVGLIADPG